MPPSGPLPGKPAATALKIALIYGALGVGWILFSDWILPEWLPAAESVLFQTEKGVLYVLLSAGLVFVLLRYQLRRVREAWEASAEGDEKFQAIASAAEDAVVLIDGGGLVRYWNPAAETMFGYTSDEMTGHELHPVVVPRELWQSARQGLQGFAETGRGPVVGRTLELRALRRDGSEFPVELSVSAARLAGRWHAVGIVRDITGREARRRELEEGRRRLEHAHRDWLDTVDAIREPLFTYDRQGCVIRSNRAYAALAGVSVREVRGRPYWELFPRREGPLPESRRLLDGSEVDEVREDVQLPDGSIFSSRAFAVLGPGGEFRYVVQVLDDVTAQRRASEALRESRRVFRSLVERSPTAMLVIDHAGVIVFLNEASAALVRAPGARDLVGRSVQEFVVPEQGPSVAQAIGKIFASDEAVTDLEFRVQCLDGTTAETEVAAIRTEYEGGPAGLVIVHDITERKRAEQAIAQERERARQYLDIAGAMLVALDRDGRIELINRRGCEVLGYEEHELLGRDWMETCIPESVRDDVRRVAETAWTGDLDRVAYFENPVLTRSGEERLVAWRNSVLYDADGQLVATLSSGEDVTERRQGEQALRRRNRALRTLSACNEALVRAGDEDQLLGDVCRVLVEQGGYPLSWVGYAQDDAERSLRPVASCGEASDYLDEVRVRWGDDELGRGPGGTTVRTGAVQRIGSIAADPSFGPWREQALARGFACVISLPLLDQERAFGVLSVYSRSGDAFDDDEAALLGELASDLAFGIRALRTEEERRSIQERHEAAMLQTVQAIARTVEMRDPYTAGHQERVARLAVALGQEMALPAARTEGLRLGSLIHDIGKIHIPAEILTRPSRLTDVEYGLIKTHPRIGYDIMKDVETPWPLRQMILQHHERL
ncbi:MAG: PAS domain S-box protein, partial [Chromatiales bacterium]